MITIKQFYILVYELAELIEENNQEKIEKYLNDNLKQFNKIDNVVLGCTHLSFDKKQLNKVLK